LQFAVNTNGTLFDDEFFDFCEREKFRIYLSLDGPEHHHDIARRTVNNTGSFKAIEKHIPRFVKLGAVALSTVTRAHVSTLFESVKWLHEQGFQSLTTSVDFDGKWSGEDFDRLLAGARKRSVVAFRQRVHRGAEAVGKLFERGVEPVPAVLDVLDRRDRNAGLIAQIAITHSGGDAQKAREVAGVMTDVSVTFHNVTLLFHILKKEIPCRVYDLHGMDRMTNRRHPPTTV
jgi:MoaA/NifB/PqqE/SkfB family radical SAM enzyme